MVVGRHLVIAPTREKPDARDQGGRARRRHRSAPCLVASTAGPDVPTPVSDGQYIYVVNDRGVVHCLDVKTGAVVYGPQRLKPGTYSASPVLAGGPHLRDERRWGDRRYSRPARQFEVVAENAVDEYTLSSIAVSNGQIFLRAEKHLYVIGKPVK